MKLKYIFIWAILLFAGVCAAQEKDITLYTDSCGITGAKLTWYFTEDKINIVNAREESYVYLDVYLCYTFMDNEDMMVVYYETLLGAYVTVYNKHISKYIAVANHQFLDGKYYPVMKSEKSKFKKKIKRRK